MLDQSSCHSSSSHHYSATGSNVLTVWILAEIWYPGPSWPSSVRRQAKEGPNSPTISAGWGNELYCAQVPAPSAMPVDGLQLGALARWLAG